MADELTPQEIDNVLLARTIVEAHRQEAGESILDKESFNKKLTFSLAKFCKINSVQKFDMLNEMINVYEFDKCYRVRPKDRPYIDTEPRPEDFCFGGSNCTNRGVVSCVVSGGKQALACFNRERMFRDIMPYEKSQMCMEHRQAALSLGLDIHNLLVLHPIMAIGGTL